MFLYFSSNLLYIFPGLLKVIEKPKKYQHIQVINDTKITQSIIVLKKHYLKANWFFLTNLKTPINYTKFLKIAPQEKIELLLGVDTNQFNRIAVCLFTNSDKFPINSAILEVPKQNYILFISDLSPNSVNKIIRKDYYEDWLYFLYNLAFLFLLIYILLHLPFQTKIKFLYIGILILLIVGILYILYQDIIYLLNIYKFI